MELVRGSGSLACREAIQKPPAGTKAGGRDFSATGIAAGLGERDRVKTEATEVALTEGMCWLCGCSRGEGHLVY